jgi:hypothetical protein
MKDPAFRKQRIENTLRYHRTDKGKAAKRNAHLKYEYGISTADYDKQLALQGGVCGICGEKDEHQRLSVDHDHKTEQFRGLLCEDCNRALGMFDDSVERLMRAAQYLSSAKFTRKYPT